MGIKIDSIVYQNRFRNEATDWLLCNVGDRIQIVFYLSVRTFICASTDNPIRLNCTDGFVGAGWIKDSSGNGFKDFRIGDTLYFYKKSDGSHADVTIVDKTGDDTIQLSADIAGYAADTDLSDCIFSLKNAITSFRYKYNFIENAESSNFLSKISGTEHLLVAKTFDPTDLNAYPMFFLGEPSYQTGDANLAGLGAPGATDGVWTTRAVIVHNTTVTPFMLSEQWADLIAGVLPPYFFNNLCLKNIFLIEASTDYTNPNWFQLDEVDDVKGNTGGFGENFNTGLTNYKIDSVVFKDATGAVIPSIGLVTTDTDVTIVVKNTTDTPFSNNNTKFELQLLKAPFDASEYQLNGRTVEQNFIDDRALQVVGHAAINGDQFGVAGRQCLKTVVGTFNNTGQITITCKISLLSSTLAIFEESEEPRYILAIAIQKHSLATDVSDLVRLPVSIAAFTIDTTDPGMIVSSNVFIRHPESDPETQGVSIGGGAELIVNGDFVGTLVGWAIAATGGGVIHGIAPNKARFQKFKGTFKQTVDITTTPSVDYTLTFIITNYVAAAGQQRLKFGGTTLAFNASGTYTITDNNAGASKEVTITCDAGPANGSTFDLTLVSVPSPAVDFDVFPEDEIVACSKFYIESATRLLNVIKLTSIKTEIIAQDGSGNTFTLDSYLASLLNIALTGFTQQFDIKIPQVFHIPTAEIRKYYEAQRRNDLDNGTKLYFTVYYAILFRWETWIKALGINAAFFNPLLPNNGFNEWWYQYAQLAGWNLYYRLTINATKDGALQSYHLQQKIVPHDYGSNALFTTKNIKFYDPNSLVELVSGAGVKYIYGYAQTLVIATFTKTTLPADYNVVIGMEVFGTGGIIGKRRYSSKWPPNADTWFVSIDGTGFVKLSIAGNTVTAKVLVDNALLPSGITSYKFSARIYEIPGTFRADNFLQTDDGINLLTDDGVQLVAD